MKYHDRCHDDGDDMDKTCRGLKNESVRYFDIAAVARRLYTLVSSHKGTYDKGGRFADALE